MAQLRNHHQGADVPAELRYTSLTKEVFVNPKANKDKDKTQRDNLFLTQKQTVTYSILRVGSLSRHSKHILRYRKPFSKQSSRSP